MTGNADREEMLAVPQVLELLGGVPRDTFYEWREKRTAPPCFRLPNGHLRVRRGDLLEGLRDKPSRAS
jgi:predicted DNA-binding transcriptional regulator AlpA